MNDPTQAFWKVPDSEPVYIAITAKPGTSAGDYRYNIAFNSETTGFYLDTENGSCVPDLPDKHTGWSDDLPPRRLTLIRCALGESRNPGIELFVERRSDNRIFKIPITGPLNRAPHDEDRRVLFRVEYGTFDGVVPSYYPADDGDYSYTAEYMGAARVLAENETPFAAIQWTLDGTQHIVRGVGEVAIRPYWGTSTYEKCDPARPDDILGCAIPMSSATTHRMYETMWIKHPPAGYNTQDQEITRWTNNHLLATDPLTRNVYYYLPWVLTHEFGHTLGIGHAPDGHIMGTYRADDMPRSLRPNDKHGLGEVLKLHSHR